MPDIRGLKRITQGTIKPVRVNTAVLEWQGTPYDGAYEVTPSQETQTLATYGKVMTENVTINPIPSNYGLITWNGSTLTVS